MTESIPNQDPPKLSLRQKILYGVSLTVILSTVCLVALDKAGIVHVALFVEIVSGGISVLSLVVQLLTPKTKKTLGHILKNPAVIVTVLVATLLIVAGVYAITVPSDEPSAAPTNSPTVVPTGSRATEPESPSPSPTRTSAPNPYHGPTKLILDDDFKHPEKSGWGVQDSEEQGCFFDSAGYHATTTNYYYECKGGIELGDFTAEISLTMQRGRATVITFRDDNSGVNYYELTVVDNGTIEVVKNFKALGKHPVLARGNGAPGKSVTVAITAIGKHVVIFLGGKKVASFDDDLSLKGYIGLIPTGDQKAEIVVTQARIWADTVP